MREAREAPEGEGEAAAAGRRGPRPARPRSNSSGRSGREIGVPVWSEGRDPVRLAKNGVKEAERTGADVVIIDTAGRLHVDPDMMKQARKIKDVTKPAHVLMACDAMTGQDAVVQAREFMREVDTTGFILTKLDGDARGGAALSMTAVTGRPIFFAGTGEKLDDLEPFYPDRMAGRILGMGDVLTLIEKAQDKVDRQGRRRRGADAAGTVQPRGLPRAAPRDEEARSHPGHPQDAARACPAARTR